MKAIIIFAILFLARLTLAQTWLAAQTATIYLPGENRNSPVDLTVLHEEGYLSVREETSRGGKIRKVQCWELNREGHVSTYAFEDYQTEPPVLQHTRYTWKQGQLVGVHTERKQGDFQMNFETVLVWKDGKVVRTYDRLNEGRNSSFTYDSRDSLVRVVQGDFIKHYFSYGLNGKLSCDSMTTSPAQKTIRKYTYDKAGRLLAEELRLEPDGTVIREEIQYDRRGNRTLTRWTTNGQFSELLQQNYDAEGREEESYHQQVEAKGSHRGTHSERVQTYFDDKGRTSRIIRESGPVLSKTVRSYTYSSDGKRVDWKLLNDETQEVQERGYTIRNTSGLPIEEGFLTPKGLPKVTRYTYERRDPK